jgi:hypothetical protein
VVGWGDVIKENEIGWACRMNEMWEYNITDLKTSREENFGDLDVDISLKEMLQE